MRTQIQAIVCGTKQWPVFYGFYFTFKTLFPLFKSGKALSGSIVTVSASPVVGNVKVACVRDSHVSTGM
jgi:hypothetical protein